MGTTAAIPTADGSMSMILTRTAQGGPSRPEDLATAINVFEAEFARVRVIEPSSTHERVDALHKTEPGGPDGDRRRVQL